MSSVELNGEIRIPTDHPCLAGHFPGHPVVPAVVIVDYISTLLLERFMDTAFATLAPELGQHAWRLTSVINARFQSPLLPQEPLSVRALLEVGAAADCVQIRAQVAAAVDGRATATLTLLFHPAS